MPLLVGRSAWYFGASIVGGGISLVVLPLSTRVIGAAEYGALAIASAVAALTVALATAAIGYVFPEHYLKESSSGRGEIASAALLAAGGGALLGLLILWPVVELIMPRILRLDGAIVTGFRLCLVGAVLGSPWVVCAELFMLEGQARAYAAGVIGQALVNGGVVLMLLYVEPMPELALFAGNLAGQATLAVIGLAAVSGGLRWPRDGRWFTAMFSKAVPIGRAALAESGRSIFERGYLAAWVSVTGVGLFSHAQLYRSWAMLALNAVSRATWPVNLNEAQASKPDFPITRASWAVVQAGIGGITMVFALFGSEIISVLSSGKFVAATPLAVILLSSLLLQTAGKPNMVLLIARREGQSVANAATAGIMAGTIAMLVLIPLYGVTGAAFAMVVQMFVTRGYLVHASRRIYPLPFADEWVLVGLVGTTALYCWTTLAEPSIISRALATVAVVCAMTGALRRQALVFFRYRGAEGPSRSPAAAAPDRQPSAPGSPIPTDSLPACSNDARQDPPPAT